MPLAPYTLEQAESDIADLRALVDRMGEVHSVADGGMVPNTPDAANYSMFSAAGQPSYINPAGLTMELSGGELATVAPVVVTQATTQNIATLFIPGGDCVAGSVYKLTTFGFGTTGSTGASNVLTTNLTHGGVGGGSQSAGSSLFGVSQAFRFYIEASLVCVTPGVGGTFWSYASWTLAQFGGNILPTGVQAVGIAIGTATTFTVDSSVGETFRIATNWAATTGGPTLTAVASYGEKIA